MAEELALEGPFIFEPFVLFNILRAAFEQCRVLLGAAYAILSYSRHCSEGRFYIYKLRLQTALTHTAQFCAHLLRTAVPEQSMQF